MYVVVENIVGKVYFWDKGARNTVLEMIRKELLD